MCLCERSLLAANNLNLYSLKQRLNAKMQAHTCCLRQRELGLRRVTINSIQPFCPPRSSIITITSWISNYLPSCCPPGAIPSQLVSPFSNNECLCLFFVSNILHIVLLILIILFHFLSLFLKGQIQFWWGGVFLHAWGTELPESGVLWLVWDRNALMTDRKWENIRYK